MVTKLLLLFAQFVPGAPMIPWGGTDFLQYYAANQLLLEGKNPYDPELNAAKQESFGRVVRIETYTPPWGFLPALPLTWLSFETAVHINIALSGLLLALCAVWWTQLFFPGQTRLLAFILICLPLWMPCLSVIGIGQISLWPLLGFTGWLWFTARSRSGGVLARRLNLQVSTSPTGELTLHRSWTQWFAGACLALLIIKPHLGLLLGVFAGMTMLRQRNWRAWAGFILTVAVATLITQLLRLGIWQDYLQSVQNSSRLALIHPATLEGWLKDNLGDSFTAVTWGIWAVALLLAGIAGYQCGSKQRAPSATGNRSSSGALIYCSAIMSTAAVAVVPYAFNFDFVLMLPGFILALGTAAAQKQIRWRVPFLIWLALECWLVAGKLATWSETSYCLVPWAGLAVTIWLAWAELKK